jgi:hypothetical protein
VCLTLLFVISNDFLFNFYKVLGQYKWPDSQQSDFIYGECLSHNPFSSPDFEGLVSSLF